MVLKLNPMMNCLLKMYPSLSMKKLVQQNRSLDASVPLHAGHSRTSSDEGQSDSSMEGRSRIEAAVIYLVILGVLIE